MAFSTVLHSFQWGVCVCVCAHMCLKGKTYSVLLFQEYYDLIGNPAVGQYPASKEAQCTALECDMNAQFVLKSYSLKNFFNFGNKCALAKSIEIYHQKKKKNEGGNQN